MTDYLQTWTKGVKAAREHEGQRLTFAASGQYLGLGLKPGDRLFIAYLESKRLHLMARVVVGDVMDRADAQRRFGPDIWEANWYVRTRKRASDPVAFDVRIPNSIVRQLRFVPATGEITRLRPGPGGSLDGKALQAIRRLSEKSAALLDAVLDDESRPRQTKSRVLPRRLTTPERKAVEDHAMKVVADHYRGSGWAVADVHADRPYDLVCRRRRSEHHVEVKGLTGSALNVELTANEVTHANTCRDTVVLAVVERITLKRGKVSGAEGGQLRILKPWRLDESDLQPTKYSYRLP